MSAKVFKRKRTYAESPPGNGSEQGHGKTRTGRDHFGWDYTRPLAATGIGTTTGFPFNCRAVGDGVHF